MHANAGSRAIPQGSVGVQAPPGSQAYPAPRGYLPVNGSPGGAAAAGYPANGAAAGHPQPHRADSRGARPAMPPSMVTAVRLMYAGAAYALVWAIGTIVVWASIVKHHPIAGDHRLAGATGLAIVLSAVDIALWLGIARACRRGRSGARVAGTALFALHTLGVLSVVASAQAGLGPAKVLTLIGWLIGFGAVVALWRRPSSAFFTARASLNR